MSKTYRIAIIGIGAIADLHARSIDELPNAELVAGSCRTQKKGEDFAQRWGCQWYDDYEKMLDDAKPDVVTITTPSGAHLEPTEACARRGIHVLCEKPLEITVERVDQMMRAARDAGIALGGIFPQRYNAVVQTIREAIKQQRFGRQLSMINVMVPWWRDDAYYAPERWQGTQALDGGGALMNQSIHSVDLLQWLAAADISDLGETDNPVDQVACYTGKLGHDPSLIEVEDTAVAAVRLRNGTLAQILGTTSIYPGTHRRILVAGRDGTAEVSEDTLTQWDFRETRSDDATIREKFGQATDHGGGASDPMAISHAGHRANINDFLDSLDSGQTPAINAPEARKAVAIIRACYESMESGAPKQPAPAPALAG